MTTSALIHDPLLFYPYSKTYYEAANQYAMTEQERNGSSCNNSVSSSSSTSSLSSMSSLSSLACRIHLEADWNQVMASVKKAMYNSTSAAVPSPVTYLCQNAPFMPMPDPAKDPAFFYNSDIVDVKDMYSYRQLRSENLLCRMFKCSAWKVDLAQTSVMRLTKGVFVANKLQQSPHPYSSPVMGSNDFMDMASSDLDTSVDTIDTFHYGNMKQLMLQQQHQQEQLQQNFTPYSYTFGARYTNPYQGRDIVIRGSVLPLWCQTLFLNECVSRMPLEPDIPYAGLFPFAPSFTIVFQSLANQCTPSNQDCFPDLTFDYERFAMEFSDPSDLMDPDSGAQWTEQKQQVMNQMLLCDITEQSALVLSQLAQLWAADQCLPF
ncbi:hypothetical protein BCR42DRAFT_406217 [Absidia repens]|uniref:Uncharacterized protein n=1 Tax=Absidia repens TaxID=90262 RepID=A0A1X2IUJ8_9FUNG|nr:hypothetical protein BCR42DRAFT_406217 [Absidia repens]